MKIAQKLLEEIVAHAVENPKVECCGIVAVEVGEDGTKTATHVYRATNIHDTYLKFEIDPKEQMRIEAAIDEAEWSFGAIYHSHTRSEPRPSQTDIAFAAGMPGIEWIIVGLAGEEPEVRSWLIEGADVKRVPLTEPSS
ncbi:MAG TPA: M67 family metallopeptidase [Solirubrobacteraceae bacterium]|nr:M67 family metallopeptidase [Solirubrobacteraceae bacterium]